VQDAITSCWAVTGNVANAPNDLFYDFNMGWNKQQNEIGEHIFFNEVIDMIGGSWGNIGQTPCCLELELWDVVMQELNENRHKVCVNYSLDWWIILYWK